MLFRFSIFLFNYENENKIKKEFSLISLAFACALKFIPLFFVPLLLFKKHFKDFFKVILYTIILFLTAFLLLKGGLSNIPLFFSNAFINYNHYEYANQPAAIYVFLTILYLLTPLIKEEWKKVSIIALLILSFNHFYGYRLLYFLPVTVLFVNKQEFKKSDILYAISLICIISPLNLTNYGFKLFGLLISFELIFIIYKHIKQYILKKSKAS